MDEVTWAERLQESSTKKRGSHASGCHEDSQEVDAWSGVVDAFLVAPDEAIVTNASAAFHLIKEKRIVGKLVGAVPSHKSQNQFHSLPLYLMPEETTYALRQGEVEQQQCIGLYLRS